MIFTVMLLHMWPVINMRGGRDVGIRRRDRYHMTHHGWDSQCLGDFSFHEYDDDD